MPANNSHDNQSLVEALKTSRIFRDYAKAFTRSFGLPIALRPAGSPSLPLHEAPILTPLYALMATKREACAAYLGLQLKLDRTVDTEPKTATCFAGLCYTIVPIRIGKNVIAFLHTGGVLLRSPSPDRLKRTMRALERLGTREDARRLRRAYAHTRVLTSSQYAAVVSLLAIFAQHLASISNQLVVSKEHLELPLIYKAKLFIIEHQDEDLTLQRAAKSVNCSVSYFCTIFRKATGLTFTDYLGRLRVEKVESLLLNPYVNISEAAYAAGFQSLSQFNRVFQKVAGETPSAWRSRLGVGSSLRP